MFWSSEKLIQNLDKIIVNGDKDKVESASYTLTIGPEVYITPNYESPELRNHKKLILNKDEDFNIPYGQFAFLLTEEEIIIPKNSIAFISFKAKFKFQGLINVSGFHVDPGYKGRLVFAMFNAGPKTVTLKRGEDFFLIWFADLDQTTKIFKERPTGKEIDTTLINNINGEVYNPIVLKDKIKNLQDEIVSLRGWVREATSTLENRLHIWFFKGIISAIIVLFLGFSGKYIWDFYKTDEIEQRITIYGQKVFTEIDRKIDTKIQELKKLDKIQKSLKQLETTKENKGE